MKIIRSIKEMQQLSKEYRTSGKSIGYVPTMGYLHEGHLKLVREARAANDIVAMSIFVNPLQFGPNEDFDRYPRDFERDERLANNAGVDVIFYPDVEEMYPKSMSIGVNVTDRVDVLCGKSREGHFNGVATVLMKLFNIISPDKAYFGMKDAQQVAVVDNIIQEFNFPIDLIPVETVREVDGLAKSSRNVYLSDQERLEASQLYASLRDAYQQIKQGETSSERIVNSIKEHIKQTTSGEVDYVEIYSYPDLTPMTKLKGKIIIALAVKFTKARLIDNLTFTI
ncbi:pantoate--beta-alanine ligase [Bacillus sp. Marseille-P3661]|uniref:pantoate--beta-alanine ligase n=1 Tax=Bacillus sp. Marseille-P3661 TaxID=1936234 RepID=UPI000C835B86|nr:pantoate--beta-alanine ligase [Bacillus sp. Marseille-P3661]